MEKKFNQDTLSEILSAYFSGPDWKSDFESMNAPDRAKLVVKIMDFLLPKMKSVDLNAFMTHQGSGVIDSLKKALSGEDEP